MRRDTPASGSVAGRGWSPAAMTAQDTLDAFDDAPGWSPEAKLRLALAIIEEEEELAEEFVAFLLEQAEAESEMGGGEDAPKGAARPAGR